MEKVKVRVDWKRVLNFETIKISDGVFFLFYFVELQIHVSGSTKEILDELGGFHLVKREEEVYLKVLFSFVIQFFLSVFSCRPHAQH